MAYREACKAYAETLELVAAQTCNLFFILASAQADRDIAMANYASADTLFRYAEGRYRIGTITKNEMLQLEINKLNEEANLLDAQTNVEDATQSLRSFLGLTQPVELRVLTEHRIPQVEVAAAHALELAYACSPDPEAHQRRIVEGKSNLARAKANAGLKADLYLQFGLSQTGDRLDDAYRRPLNQQYVSLSLSLPILDWGRGKGQVRVARSQLALTETQVAQQRQDFEQNVVRMVRQFNLQGRRVAIAWRTDSTAQQRNEVARRLYLQGKSTVLDWNASVSEKDAARRSYIQALQQFWALYYGLRSLTQYDFARRMPPVTHFTRTLNQQNDMDIPLKKRPWFVRYRYYLLAALAFVSLLAYAATLALGPRKFRVKKTDVQIARVEKADFLEYVDVEGIVHPLMTVQVNSWRAATWTASSAKRATWWSRATPCSC